jgi:predicted AAA+ superfamily ATPase
MVDLSEFFEIQARLVAVLPQTRRNTFLEKINWDARLLGVIGARGTGKTTLLLQHLTDLSDERERYLYVSADHVQVQAMGLYEIAATFFKLGGQTLFIDEIHKSADWAVVVKSLYDGFPQARIAFSGSSTLALQRGGGDLSRRAVLYSLPGLSFREYLAFLKGVGAPPVDLTEILQNHTGLAMEMTGTGPILRYYKDYIDHGVYPYFMEGENEYLPRLLNVLEKVLYEDIPSAIGVRVSNIPILKKMLWLIATSQPFVPNIERTSRDLNISKEFVYTYLEALERALLLSSILRAETGYRMVRKPSKIYLENTSLLKAVAGHALGGAKPGTIRETFFMQQVKGAGLNLHIPRMGDFLVENRYIFEVGGRSKGGAQISTEEDAYVVKDNIEVGHRDVIPLWLFGFLY